jgi:hypothetical protein
MAKTTEEILAEAKAAMAGFKNFKKPVQNKEADSPEAFNALGIRYPRITKITTVLVPEDYEWKRYTYDFYAGEMYEYVGDPEDTTIVFHGHPKQLVCFAPHFCHVMGYEPKGNESPVFLKAWREKWKS